MKKAMKSMKKKGTMKRRKAMKVSKIAKGKRAKSSVFRGRKAKTSGGLKKQDLIKSKSGKVAKRRRERLCCPRFARTTESRKTANEKASDAFLMEQSTTFLREIRDRLKWDSYKRYWPM